MSAYSLDDLVEFIRSDWPVPSRSPSTTVQSPTSQEQPTPQRSGWQPYSSTDAPTGHLANLSVASAAAAGEHVALSAIRVEGIHAAPPVILVNFREEPEDDTLYVWIVDMREADISDLLLSSNILWGAFARRLSLPGWPATITHELFSNVRLLQ